MHLVTNANEVRPPYRMYMRDDDWARCDADYGAGHVRVHWTDPLDGSQFHIPQGSAFVSKLASLAVEACTAHDLEIVFSFYMEPYGVAGHLAAAMVGVPHVVKTAGSDAGRLWQHPQFQPLYDGVFKAADTVVATGRVAQDLIAIGVDEQRIRADRAQTVAEDLFTPEGPALDVEALTAEVRLVPEVADLAWGDIRPGRRYLGVYGKLGETKGTFALLDALARLVAEGRDVGLLVMGHGRPRTPRDFRAAATELGLAERIVQLPFQPNWRVPEFIRRCLAVCCLEQDFAITIHSPIMPREVLATGTCLVGATEIIRKLPRNDRVVHGYNCIAIKDIKDTDELSAKLAAVVDDPEGAAVIGRRGRAYVLDVQRSFNFPEPLERILTRAIEMRRRPPQRVPKTEPSEAVPDEANNDMPLVRIAAASSAMSIGRSTTWIPLTSCARRSATALPPAKHRLRRSPKPSGSSS